MLGSKTVPSAHRSALASIESAVGASFTESRLLKCRARELRDSTMSIRRAWAAARALTIETPVERIGRSIPAAALLPST